MGEKRIPTKKKEERKSQLFATHSRKHFEMFLLRLALVVLAARCVTGAGRRRRGSGGAAAAGGAGGAAESPTSLLTQRLLLEDWVSSLSAQDYNGTYGWKTHIGSGSASDIFEIYNLKFSNLAKQRRAAVFFTSLGACDGQADKTIRNRFLPQTHWEGVFVEPVSMNFNDLQVYLASKGALNRSTLIRAAATSKCDKPTLEIERPLYEEKDKRENKSTPHWLRRQIASIVPKHRSQPREGWTKEEVKCVTAADVLSEWTVATTGAGAGADGDGGGAKADAGAGDGDGGTKAAATKRKRARRRRPHVLKIDVEGHDYDVLMSFVLDDTPVQGAPTDTFVLLPLRCLATSPINPSYHTHPRSHTSTHPRIHASTHPRINASTNPRNHRRADLPLMIEFEAKSIAQKFPAARERLQVGSCCLTRLDTLRPRRATPRHGTPWHATACHGTPRNATPSTHTATHTATHTHTLAHTPHHANVL